MFYPVSLLVAFVGQLLARYRRFAAKGTYPTGLVNRNPSHVFLYACPHESEDIFVT